MKSSKPTRRLRSKPAVESIEPEPIFVPFENSAPLESVRPERSYRKIMYTPVSIVILVGVLWVTKETLFGGKSESGAEIAALMEAVSQHAVLPSDEEPTVATVSDPEKLKGQEFFKNAHQGDKVLIFSRAGRAILYSPSQNKIVDIAPLNAKKAE